MIVAIDGPAGAGKSTVARLLARELGLRYLDTGAMYRSVAWLALRDGVAADDGERLGALAGRFPVTFGLDGSVSIDGTDVTAAIRTAEIDRIVSAVSGHPRVREALRERQRELAHAAGAVMEGRDIGRVVAPDAEVKVYLVADPAERVRRRLGERPGAEAEQLAAELAARDEGDSAQLERADDAVEIDTTLLTVEQVVAEIAALARSR